MFFKKVKKADLEAVSSRNVDQERQENKMMRAWISFGVVIILLILLFFASINIGSLKVGFGELLSGLFVKYNKDVATIYDLRFPRIIISMLAGAAIAVSGVLFQAVLKIHWQIRELSVSQAGQVLPLSLLRYLHQHYISSHRSQHLQVVWSHFSWCIVCHGRVA